MMKPLKNEELKEIREEEMRNNSNNDSESD